MAEVDLYEYYKRKRLEALARIEKNIPSEMKDLTRWAVFKVYKDKDDGKKKKVIINCKTGKWASSKNEETWADFSTAIDYAKKNHAEGLSFCLTESGFTCIDLDGCFDEQGNLSAIAKDILNMTNSLTEKSVSGKGLHIFLKGNFLEGYKIRADKGLEVFDNKFISLTGNLLEESRSVILEPSSVLKDFLKESLKKKATVYQTEYKSPYKLSDDEVVLKKIARSKCAVEFEKLYMGIDLLGNPSKSDFRLMGILVYFTNGDKEQCFRLFKNSGLYRLKKGDKYLETTFYNALKTTKFFTR